MAWSAHVGIGMLFRSYSKTSPQHHQLLDHGCFVSMLSSAKICELSRLMPCGYEVVPYPCMSKVFVIALHVLPDGPAYVLLIVNCIPILRS